MSAKKKKIKSEFPTCIIKLLPSNGKSRHTKNEIQNKESIWKEGK
jgi:hypothetical protein